MITLDPTQLDTDSKNMLLNLMEKAPDIEIPAGEHTLNNGKEEMHVFLKYSLLVTKKSTHRIHAEVLDKILERGSFGSAFLSLGKIKSEEACFFKERTIEKQRVIKRIALTKMSEQMILKEALRTNLADESLHCKNPHFSKEYGFLSLRRAGDVDFFKLQELLSEGFFELSLLEYLEITLAIVNAVDRLHQKGRVHRDLKAENIMVNLATLEVKLIDFALSCPSSKKSGKRPKGTLAFLPPEMFYDYKICKEGDIYSLGLTLAEFWGDSSMNKLDNKAPDSFDVFYKHRQSQKLKLFNAMDLPEETAESLSSLLHGMIRLNPEERIPLKKIALTLNSLIEVERKREAESMNLAESDEDNDNDSKPR